MTKFIFLRGYVGTLNVMDGETYATASFHEQTPEGVMGRRRLYHTDRDLYDRLNGVISHEQYLLNRDMLIEQERVRRLEMLNHIRESENQIRLFQTTTVTTVNPNWKTKIKMFFQKIKYNSVIETNSDALGIFVIATTVTIIFGLMIAKVLNIW